MHIPGAISAHYVRRTRYGRDVEVKAVEGRCYVLEAVKNEEGEA
jgi:hypothetical protein